MYLLDTNIISFFVKGNPIVAKKINNTPISSITSCVFVHSECYYGIKNEEQALRLIPTYNGIFETIQILEFSLDSAKEFTKQKKRLKESGNIIPDFDLMIACTALANDLILVTNNTKHFERIEGLELEDWTKEY